MKLPGLWICHFPDCHHIADECTDGAHPMFSFCENITIEKLDNGDVYLRRPVGRDELGLVFHFTEDKAVIISGDATMFGLQDSDAFNVITLVFSMMTGMEDEVIMSLNEEDLFR